MVACLHMSRSRERNDEVLSQEELKDLRRQLALLSPAGVRNFYDQAHQDCRMIYGRLPSPKKIQTLVQVWKQLWKWGAK